MLRYFSALLGIGAVLGMELGSDALFEGILLPLVAIICGYIVLGAYATMLICVGVWLLLNIDLTSASIRTSALYPALLLADFLALLIWLVQRGVFRGSWRHSRGGPGWRRSDNE